MSEQYVNLEQLPSGNLKIVLLRHKGNKAEVKRIHEEQKQNYLDLLELLEYWHDHDNYELLQNRFYKNIGASTSSPIIVQDLDIDDYGDFEDVGKVWWYPNYQVSDPIEILLKYGYVIFEKAENEK